MKSLKARSFEMQLLLLLLALGGGESAAESLSDSVRISLLTCSPHDEVYSLYGHSAIRYQDLRTGQDIVVNYGVFSFSKPHFILRFVFGLTDYEMGIIPYRYFEREYSYYHSGITEQELNIGDADKQSILQALMVNALPENVVYRYNFFYDNCTTRARDMLTSHLQGQVIYPPVTDDGTTFRSMVHGCTKGHPWMQLGIDLLLGYESDRPASGKDRQFLPANTMRDFARAVIKSPDGSERPLVSRTTQLLEPGRQESDGSTLISPTLAFGLFFVLTVSVTVIEIFRKKLLYLYDLLLMILTGLSGIVIAAMLFSQHPTVSKNLEILLLNPLPLIFAIPVMLSLRKGKLHPWWRIWGVMILLYMAGGFLNLQYYPPSMHLLALSLLLRIVTRRHILRHSSAK